MFIVLSLFTAYLLFLGSAVAPRLKAGTRVGEYAGLALALGILLNYALILMGLELSTATIVGTCLGAIGAARVGSFARGRLAGPRASHWPTVAWIACAMYVLVLYYFQILSEPLFRWDARSVWFFHSKMIWSEGALRADGGWTHPSVQFSSPDYPNLVPALGAQLSALKGYWNEFVPKGSLWLILLPLVCWVFSFRRLGLAFLLLLTVFFFSLHAWLWNGYMDAYVAMYGGTALLLLGRFAAERRDVDLYSAICALGIAASTKNEGLLFGAAALMAVGLSGLVIPAFSLRELAIKLRTAPSFAVAIAIAIAPTLLWGVYKRAWGLENHVTANLPGGVGRALERVSDGSSTQYLLNFLANRATVSWLLLALVVMTAAFIRYRRVKAHPGALIAIVATALYFCGMYLVYLITPANLTWHLLTSATRVMVTVSLGLLITIFFLLTSLEPESASASANPTTPADPGAVPPASQLAR